MPLDRTEFVWHRLSLHLGRRKVPVLTLVADETYPHLYRIRYPNGRLSAPGNLTRAKDAAYDHARYLLGGQRPAESPTSPETGPVGMEALKNFYLVVANIDGQY
jgi:hypothetical protein